MEGSKNNQIHLFWHFSFFPFLALTQVPDQSSLHPHFSVIFIWQAALGAPSLQREKAYLRPFWDSLLGIPSLSPHSPSSVLKETFPPSCFGALLWLCLCLYPFLIFLCLQGEQRQRCSYKHTGTGCPASPTFFSRLGLQYLCLNKQQYTFAVSDHGCSPITEESH